MVFWIWRDTNHYISPLSNRCVYLRKPMSRSTSSTSRILCVQRGSGYPGTKRSTSPSPCIYANVDICGYGNGSSREHQSPQRSRKRAAIAFMICSYVARIYAYGSIILIGLLFLPSCGFLPAKNSEKQYKMHYSHNLAWIMHAEWFACWSYTIGNANIDSWS